MIKEPYFVDERTHIQTTQQVWGTSQIFATIRWQIRLDCISLMLKRSALTVPLFLCTVQNAGSCLVRLKWLGDRVLNASIHIVQPIIKDYMTLVPRESLLYLTSHKMFSVPPPVAVGCVVARKRPFSMMWYHLWNVFPFKAHLKWQTRILTIKFLSIPRATLCHCQETGLVLATGGIFKIFGSSFCAL